MSTISIVNKNQIWRNEAGQYHRLDGPAIIYADGTQYWFINNILVTNQVVAWIKENDFPYWSEWTDAHKIMFLLAFAGN